MSRRLRIAVLSVVMALATAGSALAYYAASGTGSGDASVTTLGAPAIESATPGAGTVLLTWSPVTAPGPGSVSYYVRRDGGAASAACPGAAAPTGATSCTDSGVPVGTHTYTVTAVWRSWTATSAGADAEVLYAPVTQLVFTTQPSGASGGSAFATQPVVTARDASNDTVPVYSGTITLTVRGGAAGAALSSCEGTLRDGVTTFAGCKLDKSGTGYQLRASDGTFTADSAAFNVAVGPVTQLAFTTQPAGASGGSAFATQPVVTAQDAGGNAVTSYAGTVRLAIKGGTGTAGAQLTGCVGDRRNGVTRFTGCEIDKAGTGYQLAASDGTRTADGGVFDVTAGAVDALVFTTQPSGGDAAVAFATQPVVTAVDAGGNTVTSYAGTVTLSLGGGTAGAVLSGCVSTRVNGVTTFAGCSVDRTGSGYRLTARDGAETVTSASFNIATGALAALRLDAADTTPGAGDANSLTITAVDAGGNTVTAYTGAKSLTFGGASPSPSGTQPTVTNSAGTAVAFGTATSITFRNGVTNVSRGNNGEMVLRRAETASIAVTDGTVSNGAGLSVTVSPGNAARLAFTSATLSAGTLGSCLFTCTATAVGDGGTLRANVSVTDAEGNVVSGLGSGHSVVLTTPTRGAGSGGTFTAPSAGSSVTLSIATSGAATSTQPFTFQAQSAGAWTTNTFSAAPGARDRYTGASATVSR